MREGQILAALGESPLAIPEIVARIYAAYPASLHRAAGESVGAHLRKLENEGCVTTAKGRDVAPVRWKLA
jgi:hypothetical protein